MENCINKYLPQSLCWYLFTAVQRINIYFKLHYVNISCHIRTFNYLLGTYPHTTSSLSNYIKKILTVDTTFSFSSSSLSYPLHVYTFNKESMLVHSTLVDLSAEHYPFYTLVVFNTWVHEYETSHILQMLHILYTTGRGFDREFAYVSHSTTLLGWSCETRFLYCGHNYWWISP